MFENNELPDYPIFASGESINPPQDLSYAGTAPMDLSGYGTPPPKTFGQKFGDFWDAGWKAPQGGSVADSNFGQALSGLAKLFPSVREASIAMDQTNADQRRANLAQQRFGLEERQVKNAEADQWMKYLEQGQNIEDPAKRKFFVQALGQRWKATTGQEPPAILEQLGKVDQQGYSDLVEGIQGVVNKMTGLNLSPAQAKFFMDHPTQLTAMLSHRTNPKDVAEAAILQTELDKLKGQSQENPVEGSPVPQALPQARTPAVTPVSAQTQPGGFQAGAQAAPGALRREQIHSLVDEIATQHGFSPELAAHTKGNLAVETSGYDSKAVSPKGAQGIAQFMPATAQRFGVQDPTDERQAILGALKYNQQLEKMFPGRPDLMYAAYNAGEGAVQKAGNAVPNFPETQGYVKKAMAALQGLPAAHSNRVAEQAPDQVKQTILGYDTAINALQNDLQRDMASPLAMLEMGQRRIKNKEQQIKLLTDQRAALEKPYNDAIPQEVKEAGRDLGFNGSWLNWTAAQEQQAREHARELKVQQAAKQAGEIQKATQQGEIEKNKAQGQAATDRRLLTKEELRAYGLEPGTTSGQLADMKNKGELKVLEDLPKETQTKLNGFAITHRLTGKLIDQLQDPDKRKALEPVIGSLMSNPMAWYHRAVEGKITGLTDEQQQFAASLALQMVQLRKEFLGTAQTAGETQAAQPFLTGLENANANTILGKLKAIRDYAQLSHETTREQAVDLGQMVPKALAKAKEPDATDTTSTSKVVIKKLSPPEQETGPKASQLPQTPAAQGKAPQSALERLEALKKRVK